MSKKNSSVNLKEIFESNKEILKNYSVFEKNLNKLKKDKFLVAVSGGPDSLALTAYSKFYSLRKKSKFYFVLVDHNLRKNSSREASSVKKLLKKYKISITVLKNKKTIKKNIQGSAREIRYELLTSFCKKRKINVILTAHNLEDQVETFFIRLSRGSGLQGLSSMKQINQFKNGIILARPLLDFKKKQLKQTSKAVFGTYFKDPSNKNTKFLRIRIRKLKKTIEKSGIDYDQIYKSIKNLASSRDTLDLYLKKAFKESVNLEKKKLIIKWQIFSKFNQEFQMKILSISIQKLSKSYYSPRSKKIFYLLSKLKENNFKKSTLGGCTILKEKHDIILLKEEKK